MKNTRALMISLLLGFGAMILAALFLQKKETELAEKYDLVEILIAAKDIKRYDVIDESKLLRKSIPKKYVEPDALSIEDANRLLGYRADTFIKKGSQMTESRISKPGQSGISLEIEKDARACTIAVNAISGVAGLIRPGDHVDVIGIFKSIDPKTRSANNAEAVTLMQNIPILAVGQNYAFDRPFDEDASKSLLTSKNASALGFSNITVSTTPRQCMDLILAQQIGNLSLSLRSYLNRFGVEDNPELKTKRSTPSSISGIETPLEIAPQPKWLELRGEHSILVP